MTDEDLLAIYKRYDTFDGYARGAFRGELLRMRDEVWATGARNTAVFCTGQMPPWPSYTPPDPRRSPGAAIAQTPLARLTSDMDKRHDLAQGIAQALRVLDAYEQDIYNRMPEGDTR